jgi:radical SAM protein with 4Fe4S-binding SPASM domain
MNETCGRALAVGHDGSVFACDHFVDPGHRLGAVATDGLATLVDSPGQVAFGAEKSTCLTQTCRECPVQFVCRGGCPKDRFVDAPDGEPGHNYLCAGIDSSSRISHRPWNAWWSWAAGSDRWPRGWTNSARRRRSKPHGGALAATTPVRAGADASTSTAAWTSAVPVDRAIPHASGQVPVTASLRHKWL